MERLDASLWREIRRIEASKQSQYWEYEEYCDEVGKPKLLSERDFYRCLEADVARRERDVVEYLAYRISKT